MTGAGLALASAAAFSSAGPFGKALLETGWTPGAVVLLRLAGAALVLALVVVPMRRGRWRVPARSARSLVVYGVVAMAGTQFAFFSAVRTLDVGVALLLEFLAPVLLLAWTSLRTRTMPRPSTLAGAALTIVGLVLVLQPGGAAAVDPVGVAWALLAAVCLSGYFALAQRRDDHLPPLVMAAGGTVVGAVVIGVAGLSGALPLAFSGADTQLAGVAVPWLLPGVLLVIVATVAAYLTGIAAIVRLGSRNASFVGLTEVLFAVLMAWALLAELPGVSQLAGGVCIVMGIVVVGRSPQLDRLPAADPSGRRGLIRRCPGDTPCP